MIRGLTHFVPPQLVTNQLFDSSSRFVIIAYIIVISKVIQKLLQRASAGFGFEVQQGIIAATVTVDGLKGFAVGRQVLPMLNDPLSQGGGSHVLFQGQGVTVQDFAHVALGPECQPMFSGLAVGVGVDDKGLRVGLEGCLGQTVARYRPVKIRGQDRIVSCQIIQLHIVQSHLFHVFFFSSRLVDVVQHCSVRVDLQHVLKLGIHDHGYISVGCSSKFQDQLQVSRLLGVEGTSVGTPVGYIVKHEQRAIFVLPPVFLLHQVASFFHPTTTGLDKAEVPQGISSPIIVIQLQGFIRVFFASDHLTDAAQAKFLETEGVLGDISIEGSAVQ